MFALDKTLINLSSNAQYPAFFHDTRPKRQVQHQYRIYYIDGGNFRSNNGYLKIIESSDLNRWTNPRIIDNSRWHSFHPMFDAHLGQIVSAGRDKTSVSFWGSENGYDFTKISKRHVSPKTDGLLTCRKLKDSEFDGTISLIYDSQNERYRLFVRENTDRDIRSIQISESIHSTRQFNQFRHVNIHGVDRENSQYYSNSIQYLKIGGEYYYVGLLPWNNREACSIMLVAGKDPYNLHLIDEFLFDSVWHIEGQRSHRPRNLPCQNMLFKSDKVYCWIHANYKGNRREQVRIEQWAADRKELESKIIEKLQ